MTKFSDRLTSRSSKDLKLRISIDGVPIVFEATSTTLPPTAPMLDGRGMLVSVAESATMLDRQERRQIGGGATVVVQDRNNTLRSLFAQRSFRTTFVKTTANESVTSLVVDDVSLLPASGVVYIAGETVRYTSKTPPSTLNGCVRGYLGSPRQRHQGDIDSGAGVYLVPPSWLGRRVRLIGYFNDDDGVADLVSVDSTIETLGTFRLEEAPRDLGEGRWELRCSHLSDELAKRKLGTGISEIKTDGGPFFGLLVAQTVGFDEVLAFNAPPGTAKLLTQGSIPTFGLISVRGGYEGRGVYRIHSVTAGGALDVIRLFANPVGYTAGAYRLFDGVAGGNGEPRIVEWIKHITVFTQLDPAGVMAFALLSRLGDGTNGSNDRLPGAVSTALGGPGFQMGAGIPASEVDLTSLYSGTMPVGWSWVIDEEIPVGDLLREFCRQSNTAAVFNAAGQLRFTPLLEQRLDAVAVIAERDIKGAIESGIDDGAIYSRVRFVCSYDPIDGEYEGTVDVIDEEIAATYAPAETTLEIESRAVMLEPIDGSGLGTMVRPTTAPQELQTSLRRTMLDSRGGSLILKFRASAKHLPRQLGDLVQLSLPSKSDFRGGDLGAAKGRIIEREPDWQAFDVGLTVLVEDSLFHFATGVVISTLLDIGGGVTTVGVLGGDFGASLAAATLAGVRVGDRFRVYDPVNNVSVGLGVSVVGVTSPAFDVFDIGGSFPLAEKWVLLLMEGIASAAPDGFTGIDYTYFGPQPVLQLTSRWR